MEHARVRTVVAAAFALFGSTAAAQHDLQTWCATGSTYSYGQAMDVVGDVDGDGIAELVVVATGSTFVQSALDGRVLLSFDDIGNAVGAGDFDRDGVPDVLLADIQSFSVPDGAVEIRSGVDGGLLLHVEGGPSTEYFGAALDVIGDADGDGITDIVVGAPYAAPGGVPSLAEGRVVVCSGADGAVLHEHLGTVSNGYAGLDVAGVGDLDGDGLGDYAFQDAILISPGISQKVVRVMSGASGTPLYVLPPAPSTEISLDSMGDVDGDAVPDIAIGFGSFPGGVRAFSGATGALIWERAGGFENVTAVGDVDADGVPDIGVYGGYVGASLDGKPGVTVLSGADGTALFHIGPKGKFGSWAGPGDLDGDGRGDLVIGSPNYSLPPPGSGCVTSVSLAPPVIATLTPQQPTIAESGDSVAHLTGSGFGYVGQVNIGATTFAVGTPAVSVWSPTHIDVAIPTAMALGSEPITVSNTGAVPSNTVMLTYVETDPPVLKVPGLAFAGQPLTWSLFGGVGDHGFLLVAPDPSTIVFKGWPLLRNFVVLLPVPLDALGKAQLTLNLPAAATGHSIYSQIATKDGIGFVGTSGIVWTYIG